MNRLNNWEPDQVSGVELEIRDYDKLEETTYEIAVDTDENPDRYGAEYCVRNVEQSIPKSLPGWASWMSTSGSFSF